MYCRVRPDPNWHREGRDVTTDRTISIWDLILGCEIAVEDLLGVTLMLNVPPRTQPGSILRLRGRGLPPSTMPGRAGGPPGDLLVRMIARLPENISTDLVDHIRRETGQ